MPLIRQSTYFKTYTAHLLFNHCPIDLAINEILIKCNISYKVQRVCTIFYVYTFQMYIGYMTETTHITQGIVCSDFLESR